MPFKSGAEWNGNRKGRPKGKTFRDFWSDKEVEELVVEIKKVYKQRPEIMKMAAEHIFGKPRQNIGLDGGEENKPIPILLKK